MLFLHGGSVEMAKQAAKKKPKRISNQQIEKAKSVSIVEYVQAKGIGEIIPQGHNYVRLRFDGHDSIVIDQRKNSFYHNAYLGEKNAQGNLINFVQYTQGVSFREAIAEILSFAGDDYVPSVVLPERGAFEYDYEQAKYNSTAYNYLVKERGIDREIVNRLFQENYMIQDKFNNVIFHWTENGRPPKHRANIIGATQQLTKKPEQGQPSKWIKKNSKEHFGFNIVLGERIEKLYAFEAAIDLLSYWTLHKDTLNNCRLVSLEGVKQGTLYNFMVDTYKQMQTPFETVICVDNDGAGHNLLDHYIELADEHFTFKIGIPHYYCIETAAYDRLVEMSAKHQLKSSELMGYYLFERPFLDGSDRSQDKYLFGKGMEEGEQRLVDRLTLAKGSFQALIDTMQYTPRQVRRIYDFMLASEEQRITVQPNVLKDWNDLLKQSKETPIRVSKQQHESEQDLSRFVLTHYQALTEKSMHTLAEQSQLDPDVIDMFAKKGWIREKKETGELLYVWGKHGKIVGAETTSQEKLLGSSQVDSFIFTVGEPQSIYLFSQPSEAIAFLNINKQIRDAVFICDNQIPGYLSRKVQDYIKQFEIYQINLCQQDKLVVKEELEIKYKKDEQFYHHQNGKFVIHEHNPIAINWQEHLKEMKQYQHLKMLHAKQTQQINALQPPMLEIGQERRHE